LTVIDGRSDALTVFALLLTVVGAAIFFVSHGVVRFVVWDAVGVFAFTHQPAPFFHLAPALRIRRAEGSERRLDLLDRCPDDGRAAPEHRSRERAGEELTVHRRLRVRAPFRISGTESAAA